MKSIVIKILWILVSVLFVMTGIISLISPEVTLSSIAILLGISMLVAGISDIVTFVKIQGEVEDAGWVLGEGILTVILSLLVIFNHMITALTIPIIFTIWILFVGVSRIINAFDIKKIGISHWWVLLLLGIGLLILGICSVIKPVIASMAIGMIVGITFISQGISFFMKGYYMNQAIRRIQKILK